jgi:hypothetical protein
VLAMGSAAAGTGNTQSFGPEVTQSFTLQLYMNRAMTLVVGARDGNTVGTYELTITSELSHYDVSDDQVPPTAGEQVEPTVADATGGAATTDPVIDPGLLGTVGTWTLTEPVLTVEPTWSGTATTSEVVWLDATYSDDAFLTESAEEDLSYLRVKSRWSAELDDTSFDSWDLFSL